MKATSKIGVLLLILQYLFLVLPSTAEKTINSISKQLRISGNCQKEPYMSQTDWVSLNWTDTFIFSLKICIDYSDYTTSHERDYTSRYNLVQGCNGESMQTIGLTLEDFQKKQSVTFNMTKPLSYESHYCIVYDPCFFVALIKKSGLSFSGLVAKATATLNHIKAATSFRSRLPMETIKFDVGIFGSAETLNLCPSVESIERKKPEGLPFTIIHSGDKALECLSKGQKKGSKVQSISGDLSCNGMNEISDSSSVSKYETYFDPMDQLAKGIEEESRTSTRTTEINYSSETEMRSIDTTNLPAETSTNGGSTIITDKRNTESESSGGNCGPDSFDKIEDSVELCPEDSSISSFCGNYLSN